MRIREVMSGTGKGFGIAVAGLGREGKWMAALLEEVVDDVGDGDVLGLCAIAGENSVP